MTDPVELALALVGKDRELQQQREHIQRLSAKFSALNSRHQQLTAKLASAQRERARVERVNCVLCGQLGEHEQAALIGEQTLIIEQLRTENADLRQQLDEALQAGKRQAHPFRRRTYMDNPKKPGRKRGKGTFSHRRRPPEDRVTRHEHEPLISCPACGCTDLRDRQEHQNWQIDLPKIISDITRFVSAPVPAEPSRHRPGQTAPTATAQNHCRHLAVQHQAVTFPKSRARLPIPLLVCTPQNRKK